MKLQIVVSCFFRSGINERSNVIDCVQRFLYGCFVKKLM